MTVLMRNNMVSKRQSTLFFRVYTASSKQSAGWQNSQRLCREFGYALRCQIFSALPLFR